MKKLIVVGGIIGMDYLLLNFKPVDFLSTGCRAEAEALQERSARINHDLSGHPGYLHRHGTLASWSL
jgi:hypothetical protein